MRFLSVEKFARIALLFVLIVALRLSGAHVHYCLDGSEPSVRLHASSDLGHQIGDSQLDVEHADISVRLITAALSRQVEDGSGLSVLLAVFLGLLFLLLQPKQFFAVFDLLLPLRARLLHACPPLRGPPL